MNRVHGNSYGAHGLMPQSDRLLRRRQVEEMTGLSRSSVYRLMQDGEFPRPVRVGSNAVRWRLSDIVNWLESRPIAGGMDAGVRAPATPTRSGSQPTVA